ncbi:hypothetical protein LEMLEM_LOCUS7083, partial [Lemmus lemmus]
MAEKTAQERKQPDNQDSLKYGCYVHILLPKLSQDSQLALFTETRVIPGAQPLCHHTRIHEMH